MDLNRKKLILSKANQLLDLCQWFVDNLAETGIENQCWQKLCFDNGFPFAGAVELIRFLKSYGIED